MRPIHESHPVEIRDDSAVGHARRTATSLAEKLGLDEAARGKVALVVTEAGTNLVQHAGGGEMLFRASSSTAPGLEILALDKGPGMANVSQCLEDGYSTGGSRGAGLGSIMRLSDAFDIFSQSHAGTALYSRIDAAPPSDTHTWEWGAVCVALAGEDVSGDGWSVQQKHDRLLFTVIDGLGHGPEAAIAAETAITVFEAQSHKGPQQIIEAMQGALRATRGAAAVAIEVDSGTHELRFAGVGNISGTVVTHGHPNQNLTSYNGIVGQQVARLKEFQYTWRKDALLLVHTDGLGTRWTLDRYPGLIAREPSLIAGVLYRDFFRGRDDVTVFVARERSRLISAEQEVLS